MFFRSREGRVLFPHVSPQYLGTQAEEETTGPSSSSSAQSDHNDKKMTENNQDRKESGHVKTVQREPFHTIVHKQVKWNNTQVVHQRSKRKKQQFSFALQSDTTVNPIIEKRRPSWTQVDYTLLMGHVSLLSDAIPSIHAPHKCLCEIQSHLSEVKWESFARSSLPDS